MELNIEIPGIKKVLYESVFVRGYQQRIVTKVYFRNKSALTFCGSLPKKEARRQAVIQKAMELGMTPEEAEVFADSKAQVR
jgi:protocatechuate 3,4-dioxygenase beta subunit